MDLSKEDILKRFNLPERQSKIDTLLKLNNNAPVYCVCKSTDIDRFMICCEKCDEWYHGDCIDMTENDSKYIKKWYCSDCIVNYNLEVVHLPRNGKTSSKHKKEKKPKGFDDCKPLKNENFRCGQCSNCLQNEECGNQDFTFANKPAKYQHHEVLAQNILDEQPKSTKVEKRNTYKKKQIIGWTQQQCLGPQCVKSGRSNSKYCSDECGLALGKIRILNILPYRIMEREQVPCVADQLDKAKLNNVRSQIKFANDKLKKLDYKEKKLTELIARAKQVPIVDHKDGPDEESKMYCLTCGWEIPSRSATRHMEMCFKKLESQTSVFGLTKSNSDNCKIFCDYYDGAKQTYCKRLRYICPDHLKPRKIPDSEVCGCPIIKNISRSIFSGAEKFCQRPKKKCDYHYNWELLAVAEIDFERLREWNKISELIEEEAMIVRQLSNRCGALGLLLHSTHYNETVES